MPGVLVLAVGWAASILFLMTFFTRLAWASPSMAVNQLPGGRFPKRTSLSVKALTKPLFNIRTKGDVLLMSCWPKSHMAKPGANVGGDNMNAHILGSMTHQGCPHNSVPKTACLGSHGY